MSYSSSSERAKVLSYKRSVRATLLAQIQTKSDEETSGLTESKTASRPEYAIAQPGEKRKMDGSHGLREHESINTEFNTAKVVTSETLNRYQQGPISSVSGLTPSVPRELLASENKGQRHMMQNVSNMSNIREVSAKPELLNTNITYNNMMMNNMAQDSNSLIAQSKASNLIPPASMAQQIKNLPSNTGLQSMNPITPLSQTSQSSVNPSLSMNASSMSNMQMPPGNHQQYYNLVQKSHSTGHLPVQGRPLNVPYSINAPSAELGGSNQSASLLPETLQNRASPLKLSTSSELHLSYSSLANTSVPSAPSVNLTGVNAMARGKPSQLLSTTMHSSITMPLSVNNPKPNLQATAYMPSTATKNRSNTITKSSLSLVKDKDHMYKVFDKERYNDKEESAPNLLRRKDILTVKLALMERRALVGAKGPGVCSVSPKVHFDYLINEAQAMAIDYHQELRWKLSMCQTVAHLCKESVMERRLAASSAKNSIARGNESPYSQTLKGIASKISEKIVSFWNQFDNRTNAGKMGRQRDIDEGRRLGPSPGDGTSLNSLGIMLLDHQKQALSRVLKFQESGCGCVVTGRRFVGKTTLLVAAIDSWLSQMGKSMQTPKVFIFASRKIMLRWSSEIDRILPHRRVSLWLPDQSDLEANSHDIPSPEELNSISSSKSLLNCDIVLCILESAPFYVSKLQSLSVNVSGIIIDVRGYANWTSKEKPSSSNDDANSKSNWLADLSKTFDKFKVGRVLCCDDQLTQNELQILSPFLDNSSPTAKDKTAVSNSCPETSDDDWKNIIEASVFYPSDTMIVDPSNDYKKRKGLTIDVTYNLSSLFVEVSVGGAVESFALAQVREEIVAQDMDSLQHLKYYQVMDALLNQMAFQGDNPWILAQALTLLRKVCFHESFISIGASRKSPLSNIYDEGQSKASESDLGIGLPFGLIQASLHTGIIDSTKTGSKSFSGPERFCENMRPSVWLKNLEANKNSPLNEGLRKYMTITPDLNIYSDANFATNTNLRPMNCCFAPGPLSSKLSSPPRFNMNGNFYDSIGSCKLQVLCALISRFSGLRIVIVVSTIDEQLTVHNFLNRLGFEHSFAGLQGSKVNEHILLDGSGVETATWLRTQAIIQKFNRTPQTASALMVCTKDVFLQPGLIPWKADVVIMLSDDWITPTDIRSCFRLRLTSAGPSGDPVTVVRIVAKGTLEELVARRGSLVNLQNISLSDLFPSFSHTIQALISSGLSSSLLMLFRAPAAALVRKIRDITISSTTSMASPAAVNKMMASTASSPATPEEVVTSCAQWLCNLRLGLLLAELQFSKLGKYLPQPNARNNNIPELPRKDSASIEQSVKSEKWSQSLGSHRDLKVLNSAEAFCQCDCSVLAAHVADRILDNYIIFDSIISKVDRNAQLRDDSVRPKRNIHPISSLIVRLIDSRVRNLLFLIESAVESIISDQSDDSMSLDQSKSGSCFTDADLRRLGRLGLGPKSLSNAHRKFLSLVLPITYSSAVVDVPRERDLQGPTMSCSHKQNGSSFFRSSMLFRQIVMQYRQLGSSIDTHLYVLSQLQAAVKNEFVLKPTNDFPVVVSIKGSRGKSDSESRKIDERVESTIGTKSTSGSNNLLLYSSMYKADLTGSAIRIEYDPAMKEDYHLIRKDKALRLHESVDGNTVRDDALKSLLSGKEESSQTDIKHWLMSVDGLILAIPALFHDDELNITNYYVNNILPSTSLAGSMPMSTDAIRERYVRLQASGKHFSSKNADNIGDIIETILTSPNHRCTSATPLDTKYVQAKRRKAEYGDI